ncbi:MAG: Veg family protein [Bacilli bacterium]|nr:Veg family protein [Bacilli bacterium]MDD3304667.1 Veg family protein [Bacilli bacterium]MDD4053281.1 Veg family protein [Bacilli bacterium]MDD4411378.1 Veg family protein [Bacilli bacterium]
MIKKIKDNMEEHIGEEVKIIFNGGRNRIEEYNAVITQMYDFVFVVKLNNEVNELKSFTYSDVLTQTVEIYYK